MTPDDFAAALSDRLRRRGPIAFPEDVRSFTADIGQRMTDAPDMDQWVELFVRARQPPALVTSGSWERVGQEHERGRQLALWLPWTLAYVLALGGCFWGLLLSPWLFRPDVSPLAVVIFGPGYLVTLGYIVRSVCTPPLMARRLIWIASLLVQGAWLAWFAWALVEKIAAGGAPNEPALPVAWWVFATAASAIGLFTEKSKRG
jgi:hypothetical protein